MSWEEMDARRKQFDDYKKKISKDDADRKSARKSAEAKKSKAAEIVAKRQNQANQDIQALMEQAASEGGSEDGKKSQAKLGLGGVFGGGSGAMNDRGRNGGGSNLKAPPGAVIPGLEQSQQNKEANKKYSTYSGPRFSSATYGSVGASTTPSVGSGADGGSGGIRRNLRF